GGPARLPERRGPHLAIDPDRLPAGLRRELRPRLPAPERVHPPPGHDRPPRGDGGHTLGMRVQEAHALAPELVPRRRPRAVAEDVVGPQAVHHDDHHVHPLRRLARRAAEPERGIAERAGSAGTQQVATRNLPLHAAGYRPLLMSIERMACSSGSLASTSRTTS